MHACKRNFERRLADQDPRYAMADFEITLVHTLPGYRTINFEPQTSNYSNYQRLHLGHITKSKMNDSIDTVNAPNIQGDAAKTNTYDAIVIGSGMSGGWAAKEFCEKGLKTLVLERGRNVEHIKDYPTATKQTWEFPHRGRLPLNVAQENPILSKCYAFEEATEHFFVKDNEHPYVQVKPFDWIKGYQVGGKSLLWARMTQRWSEFDFESNAKDGHGTDWPIRYKDIAPWYSYVEKFVGVSGNKDGLYQIPDGEFLPPMELNCLEKHFQESVNKNFPARNVVISRTTNLTQAHNGQRTLSIQKSLPQRMSFRWILQFEFFDTSRGSGNGQYDLATILRGSFYYLR